MASSTGSLETSSNSLRTGFSFPSSFSTSFSDLLAGAGDEEGDNVMRNSMSRGSGGIPKFKSIPPPSLPLSPPPFSPSSYFSIPAGLSPAELLDSPVLLSSSNILSSPTTGTFPTQAFNWKFTPTNYQQGAKEEHRGYPDFSFQTHSRPGTTQPSTEEAFRGNQQPWSYQELIKNNEISPLKFNVKAEPIRTEIPTMQTGAHINSSGVGGYESNFNHSNQS